MMQFVVSNLIIVALPDMFDVMLHTVELPDLRI